MAVLVACEYSGTVRDAFAKRGHFAMSCDIKYDENWSPMHYRGDVRNALRLMKWDLIIAFPPCNHLSYVGARHFKEKQADGRQQRAIDFVMTIAEANCPRIVIENPVGILEKVWRGPDQIIEPYMFGHPWRKRTCLWLKGVPLLKGTNWVEPQGNWVQTQKDPSGTIKGHRGAKLRARTFTGVAEAMAEQWG